MGGKGDFAMSARLCYYYYFFKESDMIGAWVAQSFK